jgi:hypothetical protein
MKLERLLLEALFLKLKQGKSLIIFLIMRNFEENVSHGKFYQ